MLRAPANTPARLPKRPRADRRVMFVVVGTTTYRAILAHVDRGDGSPMNLRPRHYSMHHKHSIAPAATA
jgi:hypothetical protein